MVAVTDLGAWYGSQPVATDAYGNNVAFSCPNCGGPVLATLMSHKRGSSSDKPTQCRICAAQYWVEPELAAGRLKLHALSRIEAGRYAAGRSPAHTAAPNIASWSVISAMLAAYGSADYDELVAAVRQHDRPGGGKGFVDYCIDHGWLQRL